MSNFLLILVCFALGAAGRAWRFLPERTAEVFNRFILYVSLPALAFVHVQGMARAPLSSLLYPVLSQWIAFVVGTAFFVACGSVLSWDRRAVGALVLTGGLANTSFVGFPLLEALYGPTALDTAVWIDQLGSFLLLSTLGLFAAAWASSRKASASALFLKIVRFPPLIALFAGVLARGLILPDALHAVLTRLGGLLVPLALVSVGFQLKLSASALKRQRARIFLGIGYRLALAPLLILAGAWGLARMGAASLNALSMRVTILEAAMAPMITGAIVADEYGLEPELANLMVGVGIPLSLLSVPFWASMLAWGS